ncbi:MAG: DUF2071 domain-containing protein [Candidatus Sericytochromatia bacterium]
MATALPLHLPWTIQLELRGYTLLVYRLPEDRLRGLVPAELPLEVFEADGRRMTWLTVFLGENVLKGVAQLPAVPLSFYQVNYRAYVRAEGQTSLYILRSAVSHPLVAAGARATLSFPAVWQPVHREAAMTPRQVVRMGAGGAELTLRTVEDGPLPLIPPFESPEAATAHLADVPVARYAADGRQIKQIQSPHPPIAPQNLRAEQLELRWANEAGILTAAEAAAPLAIYWQARAAFPLRV